MMEIALTQRNQMITYLWKMSCIKEKRDNQQYLKNYYGSNTERYKKRYQEKREILKKKKIPVSKNKKNFEEKEKY